MKIFKLKNPEKPPAYLRLYTAEGMAIAEFKIDHFNIEQDVLGDLTPCTIISFKQLKLANVQTPANSCLGEAQFESQPGRAIRAYSYTLNPKTRANLTINKDSLSKIKVNKTVPAVKRHWWEFWK